VHFVGSIELPRSAPALLQVLWITAVLFLLPSVILGMPTPLLTRLSLESVEHAGAVVGRIQASAAAGSIFFTFLTGFYLISEFGTRHIVTGVAAVLLVLAVLARPPWLGDRMYELGSVAFVIVATGAWGAHSPCTRESAYYCIRVTDGTVTANVGGTPTTVTTPGIRFLYLDHLLHSAVDLSNPTNLLATYEQRYASVLDALRPPGSRLDSFFIGGGGYVFPRYVEANYHGRIDVAEIDPEVTAVAREYLGLTPSPRLRTITGDARRTLEELPGTTKFDAVFGDAADDFEVPYELTTREFGTLVSRHLRPDGVYLLNVIDAVHYDFLRSEIRTLRLVFPYVALVHPSEGWPLHGGRDTFVVVASNTPPSKPLPVISAADLNEFVAAGHSVVLTDDHAPVDQLLAPVFDQELKGS
jgi:hypothetical protein